MTIGLALAAALAFGTSVALQKHAASAVTRRHRQRLGLLLRIVRQPVWCLGLLSSILGFLLQTAALRHGSLVVVQVALTSALIFALALVAVGERQPLRPGEWLAAGAVTAGLATFLVLVLPRTESRPVASASAWWTCAAILCGSAGLAAVAGIRASGPARALRLGLAVGMTNGLVAVLTKSFAEQIANGVTRLPLHWPFWALLAAMVPAVILVQSLYRSSHTRISLPVVAVAEPAVACCTGLVLFHERVHLTHLQTLVMIAAAVVISVGLFWLARAPRLTGGATS